MSSRTAGFTLDAALREQRRAQAARRVHTIEIPLARAIGFLLMSVLVVLHDAGKAAPAPAPPLAWLLTANASYASLSWIALRWSHGRLGRFDASLAFLHLDVALWLLTVHHLESSTPFFGYLLLVRVADQIGFGFRRALYFSHVVPLSYLAYAGLLQAIEPAQARWAERLSMAMGMYPVGLYLALTGLVIERLRNRTREAVHAARALVDDLALKNGTLERQAEQLRRAREDAEQASLAKSQFLATISHEIRTPMNGILGAAELLLGTKLTHRQEQYVRTAHRSATALLSLIDDVLDLSRIEAGKLEIEQSDFAMGALVGEAIDATVAAARDKPVSVRHRIGDDVPPYLRGDANRLRQVLLNLLHNALKFTERGLIELVVEVDAPQGSDIRLAFEVRDTGVGIPEEKIATIFDAFTQADASKTRRYGGSGLGLTIVKELVEAMGGSVSARSRLGEGSTFRVALPLETGQPILAHEGNQATPLGDARPRLLVAEDDPVNQLIVREMLVQLGCEVDVVADGQAAFDAVHRTSYDLLLLDLHMPVLDGHETARRIRSLAEPRMAALPIVALTANALPGDRERCLDVGMDDFVTKPVTLSQLGGVVRRWAAPHIGEQPTDARPAFERRSAS